MVSPYTVKILRIGPLKGPNQTRKENTFGVKNQSVLITSYQAISDRDTKNKYISFGGGCNRRSSSRRSWKMLSCWHLPNIHACHKSSPETNNDSFKPWKVTSHFSCFVCWWPGVQQVHPCLLIGRPCPRFSWPKQI